MEHLTPGGRPDRWTVTQVSAETKWSAAAAVVTAAVAATVTDVVCLATPVYVLDSRLAVETIKSGDICTMSQRENSGWI